MAKFCIFSDIHIHPWSAFSTQTEDGINSRLIGILETLEKIFGISRENKCDAILFSGDFFHTSKIAVETHDLAAQTLSKAPCPLVMIPGNHDEASRMAQFHSLRAFGMSSDLIVLDEGEGSVGIDKYKIGGIPFYGSRKKLNKLSKSFPRCDILLMHTGFAGASMGSDFIADQKQFLDPMRLKKRREIIIAGHFHQPQVLSPGNDKFTRVLSEGVYKARPGTILIPGAPLQHTFGDAGSWRGCWILDMDKANMTFKAIDNPRFVSLKSTEEFKAYGEDGLKGSYVSARVSRDYAAEARAILERNCKGYTLSLTASSKKTKGRLGISLDTSVRKALKTYIKANPEDGVDPKRALTHSLNLLKDVGNG